MKNSKQKQELIDSIKEMEDVYNDAETPADIKNSLEPSIKNAKEQLKQLEQAEQQEQVTVTAEKKVPKTAAPVEKKKKAVAKKKAATTVRKVKKRITEKLPSIRATINKAKAALTKVKGRTPRGKEADASRKALPPGTRISKSGKQYREYRENRADVQRKKVPYLAKGGTVDDSPVIEASFKPEQVNVFGYHTKYLPKEVAGEFKKAVVAIESEPDKESMYYHNTSEALKEFANTIDTIFLGLEAFNMKMVIAAALYAGIYNYKSGMHVSIDVLVLAMTKVLKGSGKSFARERINEMLEAAGIDTKDFYQKVADVKYDVRYGTAGLDEDYEGFTKTRDKIDEMLDQAEIPATLYYDNESGSISESEPDFQEGEEWHEVSTKDAIYGDLASFFRRGGRIKSAINRDWKYKSDEPWEKKYHRKTRPKNPRYAAEGAALRDKKYDDFFEAAEKFYQELGEIEDEFEGDDAQVIANVRDELHEYMVKDDQSRLFSIIVNDIEWLQEAIGKNNPLIKPSIEAVQTALQKFKWFIYDETNQEIIEAFYDTKEADKYVKQFQKENPKIVVEGYSAAHLKKIGKDPFKAENWIRELARGGKLKINKEYNWFVYNLHTGKILAGNEYREDADDAKKEIKEAHPAEAYTVYSAKYIQGTLEKDPYDSANWSNPGYNKAFLGMTLINSIDNTLVASSQGAVAM